MFRIDLIPEAPVLQSAALSGASFNFAWSTVMGQIYQLQCTTNLVQTNWNNVGIPVVATNSTQSVTDFINSGSQRFYRVLLLP